MNDEPIHPIDQAAKDDQAAASFAHLARLASGEAYMMCDECGAKLYSFDGKEDSSRPCPYKRHGQCDPGSGK